VPAELLVTATPAGPATGDDLRSLRTWLSDVDELRGRVRIRPADAPPGTLGVVTDTLVVTAPIVAALAPALISWIRSRHTDLTLTVTGSDGSSVEISAQRMRRLGAEELGPEIERLIRTLDETRSGADAAPGSAGDRAG
jgi:hypothetical protein